MLNNRKTIARFLSISSIILGVAIYSFFRKPPLLLTKLYKALYLESTISSIQDYFAQTSLPEWVLYGLPDLLWMFSFTLVILLIWGFKANLHSILWIGIVLIIGLLYEILQFPNIVPGVFDVMDLLYITTGALMALFFTIKSDKYVEMD